MKKHHKIIIGIVVALVVLLAFYFAVLHPRVLIYASLQTQYSDIGVTAQDFTAYEAKDDSLVTVQGEYFSIAIPADFVKQDFENDIDAEIYKSEDEKEQIFWLTNAEEYDLSLLNPELYEDMGVNYININEKTITRGFRGLGYGIPDSYYNTSKCALQVTEDDYSFINLDKGIAYYFCAVLRNEIYSSDGVNHRYYIYETEDIYAIIHEGYSEEDEVYSYTVDVFQPDNLNVPHAMRIRVEDSETAYAIINSIEFYE